MDQNAVVPIRNPDFPWAEFDPFDYVTRNYSGMRSDDALLMYLTRAWFAEHSEGGDAQGVDVGCGPNLYPSLAMLPSCSDITLLDYSPSNIAWLRSQIDWCSDIWRPYWSLISPEDRLGDFEQARAALAKRARIEHGSVFDLPTAKWDLGTMFFVAESITPDYTEFGRAVTRFLRALRPGAPFAAAFMQGSQGYEVGGVRFPAVRVEEREVRSCLGTCAAEVRIHRLPAGPTPFRSGYTGILLALGTTA
jgi:hypothetical protein